MPAVPPSTPPRLAGTWNLGNGRGAIFRFLLQLFPTAIFYVFWMLFVFSCTRCWIVFWVVCNIFYNVVPALNFIDFNVDCCINLYASLIHFCLRTQPVKLSKTIVFTIWIWMILPFGKTWILITLMFFSLPILALVYDEFGHRFWHHLWHPFGIKFNVLEDRFREWFLM